MNPYKHSNFLSLFTFLFLFISCSSSSDSNDDISDLIEESEKNKPNACKIVCDSEKVLNKVTCECENTYPLSDPNNTGNWILNPKMSDEFEAAVLDEEKWHIQGKNNEYYSNFIGRAPSQFSTDNIRLENGKLKLQTRWQPDFEFNTEKTQTVGGTVYRYENITTAAVISKNMFQFGYMEIKSKSAKAPITSSFWTTGNRSSELDMFETFGGHKSNATWRKRLKFNMISWNPDNPFYQPRFNGPTYTANIQSDYNTADDFHVYGFEWTSEYIYVYIDGILHPEGQITKDLVTKGGTEPDRWITDVAYRLWFDSETFPWLGLPTAADLPADYEIEYIRVWQKNE